MARANKSKEKWILKVLLYSELQNKIEKSGVGRALRHQQKALSLAGVPYTMDPKEPYDLVHINTIFLRSFLLAKKAKRNGKKVVYHAHSTGEDFRNSFVGFQRHRAPFYLGGLKNATVPLIFF